MNAVKRISYLTASFLLVILLSSWGYQGHKKISECAPPSFPSSMSFLLGHFSTILVDSCIAADNRKDWDDTEAPKHFIDIDNYPEFLLSGKIPQSWDSIVKARGLAFVLDNGIIPWSTMAAFDSVRDCFARENWDKAALFAADLGHYVGDGHMPLHLTANYNGQLTGQVDIHYRYETKMINAYVSQIIYPFDSAQYIPDIQSYIFTYIYANYVYADSVLYADRVATTLVGNTNSAAYTLALWNNTKSFTIPLFHHASFSLASLLYTAYVESQHMAIKEILSDHSGLGMNYPNPVKDYTVIPFDIEQNNSNVSLKIFDALGNIKAVLLGGKMGKGHHEIKWDARGLSNGIYYCVLATNDAINTKKLLLMH